MKSKLLKVLIAASIIVVSLPSNSFSAESVLNVPIPIENCKKIGNNIPGAQTRYEDAGHILDWSKFLKPTGKLRTLIIPIDLPDARAKTSIAEITEFGRNVSSEMSRLSRGEMTLEIEVMPNWITLPKPSNFYVNGPWGMRISDSLYSANQSGANFSRFDLFIIKVDPRTSPLMGTGALPMWGGNLYDGVKVIRGAFLGLEWTDVEEGIPVAIHEILHVFGLPDLYLVNPDGTYLSGRLDIMGRYIFPKPYTTNLLEWNRWTLGWSKEELLSCFDGTQPQLLSITLDDSESSSAFIDLGDSVLGVEVWQDNARGGQNTVVVYEISPKTYVWASGRESGKTNPIQIIRPNLVRNYEGTFFVKDSYLSERFKLRFIDVTDGYARVSFTPNGQTEVLIPQTDSELKAKQEAEAKAAAELKAKQEAEVKAKPKVVKKKANITCVKGKAVKKVTAIKPKCPAGYKKK